MLKKSISLILAAGMLISPANMSFCYAEKPGEQRVQAIKQNIDERSKKISDKEIQALQQNIDEILKKLSDKEIQKILKEANNLNQEKSVDKTTPSFTSIVGNVFQISFYKALSAGLPTSAKAILDCISDDKCSFINLKNDNNVFSKFNKIMFTSILLGVDMISTFLDSLFFALEK